MNEYEVEPVRGLPENLPAGERMLWQGAPAWRVLARRAFHVRKVAVYFCALIVWRVGNAMAGGTSLLEAASSATVLATVGVVALGILTLLAWLIARTTVYTITDRRLVMRFGLALPMAVNLPFTIIRSAAVKHHADGSGDLPLVVKPGQRVSYVVMWPHVRPWRLLGAEPMLRSVPDARRVADILGSALAAAAGQAPDTATATAANPAGSPEAADAGSLATAR